VTGSTAVAPWRTGGALAAAVRRRPDLDPGELIAAGWDQLHPQLDAYLDVGLTKFVIRQAGTAPLDASSTGSLPSWRVGRTEANDRF
jgi:hypothetical protein